MNFGNYTNFTDLFNAIQARLAKRPKTFTGTKAEWGLLNSTQKAEYQIVNFTDDYDVQTELDDTKTTTTNVWSASKVDSELSNKANASALPIKTNGQSANASATSVTITNSNITANSFCIPFTNTTTPVVIKTMTITAGQCVLTFDALSAATTFYLLIFN